MRFNYLKPMNLAILNLSGLFLLGLITSRRVVTFFDVLCIAFGGVLALVFILSIITTHKMKQMVMDPDEVNKVITTGIFKYLRHPVYAGIVYMNIGFIFFFRSLVLIPLIVFFSLLWYYEARYEEQVLIRKFGAKYKNYMKKTGMFFPKIRLGE
ncbi:MAG: isoprenylcysteine carboxylmethyltransferase family protein [Nanoarchaeota archaeon]|nr:isoprenylcysteine carboxylmethyltransferase family protein [Nanoarchaeota archaeon]